MNNFQPEMPAPGATLRPEMVAIVARIRSGDDSCGSLGLY